MTADVKIDRSLALGAYRQELRQNPFLFTGEGDPDMLETKILETCVAKAERPRMRFGPDALKAVARAVSSLKLADCEEFYSFERRTVPGSVKRSYLDMSFRSRPVAHDEVLSFRDGFFHLRKDRVLHSTRAHPVSISVHAVQRYIQRGMGVNLAGRTVEGVLNDVCSRSGLFVLLGHVAGAWLGQRFAVPFREGLLLCESMNAGRPSMWKVEDGRSMRPTDSALLAHAPHMLHWLSGEDGPGVVHARTFVGRSEMKHGQVSFHRMVEDVYARAKDEIDLLGRIAGRHYMCHQPETEESLRKAVPRLDWAVKEIARELAASHYLSYAFVKEDGFSVRSVSLPSKACESQDETDAAHAKAMEAAGASGLKGGLVANIGWLGVPGKPYLACIYETAEDHVSYAADRYEAPAMRFG